MRPPVPSGALLAVLLAVSPAFAGIAVEVGAASRAGAGSNAAASVVLSRPMDSAALLGLKSFLSTPGGAVAFRAVPDLRAVLNFDPKSRDQRQALGALAAVLPPEFSARLDPAMPESESKRLAGGLAGAYLASLGPALSEFEARARAELAAVPDGPEGAAALDRLARRLSAYGIYGDAARGQIAVLKAAARGARAMGTARAMADDALAEMRVPAEFLHGAEPTKLPRGGALQPYVKPAKPDALGAAPTAVDKIEGHPVLLGSPSDENAPLGAQLKRQLGRLFGEIVNQRGPMDFLAGNLNQGVANRVAAGILARVLGDPKGADDFLRANPKMEKTGFAELRFRAAALSGAAPAPGLTPDVARAVDEYFTYAKPRSAALTGLTLTPQGPLLKGGPLENLGAGTFGKVDVHPLIEGVIVKTLFDNSWLPAVDNARIDAETTARLHNAGVGPKLLEVHTAGQPVIVKERVYGATLWDLIRAGRYGLHEHALVTTMMNGLADARVQSDDMREPNIMIGRTLLNPEVRAYFIDGGNLSRWPANTPREVIRTALYTQPTTINWWHDAAGNLIRQQRPFNHILEEGLVRSGEASWWLWAKTVMAEEVYARYDPLPEGESPRSPRQLPTAPDLQNGAGRGRRDDAAPTFDPRELAALNLSGLERRSAGWFAGGRELRPVAGDGSAATMVEHPSDAAAVLKILPDGASEADGVAELSAARAVAAAGAGPRDLGGTVASGRIVRVRESVHGSTLEQLRSQGRLGDAELELVRDLLGSLAEAGVRVDGIRPGAVVIGTARDMPIRRAWLVDARSAAPFDPRLSPAERVNLLLDLPASDGSGGLREFLYARNGAPRHWSLWRRLLNLFGWKPDPLSAFKAG